MTQANINDGLQAALKKQVPFDAAYLASVKYNREVLEVICCAYLQNTKQYMAKNVPGFSFHGGYEDIKRLRITQKTIDMQNFNPRYCVEYVKALGKTNVKVDASNVGTFISHLSQIGKAKVTFQKKVYTIKDRGTSIVVPVKNCFCHIDKVAQDYLSSKGVMQVELSSPQGSMLVIALMSSVKFRPGTFNQPNMFDDREVNGYVTEANVPGIKHKYYDNPAVSALRSVIELNMGSFQSATEVVDAAMNSVTNMVSHVESKKTLLHLEKKIKFLN